jgi:thiamine biosynthesis lipoprotein
LNRRTELDLGALARGAMLDAALAQLRAADIPAGRASTMGEHAVYGGTKERPWEIRLLIRGRAAAGTQERVGTIDILDGAAAVASQGPTTLTPDGAPVHDRFDARTGYPVRGTRWLAVEIDTAAEAGGWADAIFALGPEGRAFVEGHERLRAVIAPDDGPIWHSTDLRFEELQP